MTDLRSVAEIDPAALRHNAAYAKRLAGGADLMAVVKADGYGHGAVRVAEVFREFASWFGVATVDEALELRRGGIAERIFLLGPLVPAERAVAAREGFVPIVSCAEEAGAFSALGVSSPVEVHLAVDTGMGRAGVWHEEAPELLARIARLDGIAITGVCTHLPSADDALEFTTEQLTAYARCVERLREISPALRVAHALNSAGLLRFPGCAPDMVRAGLMLYGVSPLPGRDAELRPALSWKTRVALVSELGPGRTVSYGRTYRASATIRAATLAVGYADGYRRTLSGHGAEVLIRGRRCSVLGTVTMDQIVVDVTPVPGVAAGDEAVLIGRQDAEEISAEELAAKAGTIPWEILTGIGPRVPRRTLQRL